MKRPQDPLARIPMSPPEALVFLRERAQSRYALRQDSAWQRSSNTSWRVTVDWNQCYQSSANLFDALDKRSSARVCLAMMEDFVAELRRQRQNTRSLAIFLTKVRRIVVNQDRSAVLRSLPRYSARDGENLDFALLNLNWVVESLEEDRDRTEECCDCVSRIVMAWYIVVWGNAFAEVYDTWKALPHTTLATSRLRRQHWNRIQGEFTPNCYTYPPSVEIEYRKWLLLADLFEPLCVNIE